MKSELKPEKRVNLVRFARPFDWIMHRDAIIDRSDTVLTPFMGRLETALIPDGKSQNMTSDMTRRYDLRCPSDDQMTLR